MGKLSNWSVVDDGGYAVLDKFRQTVHQIDKYCFNQSSRNKKKTYAGIIND